MECHIKPDLSVYCGGACDGGGIAAAVPKFRAEFRIGNLQEDSLVGIIERYLEAPPRIVKELQRITWGELAKRYGDRSNEELYYLSNLAGQKWVALYLEEVVPSLGFS